MTITVNGEGRDVTEGTSITALLESLGLQPEATVVQHNDEIVDRAQYGEVLLAAGDVLELVRFVGGG